MSELVSSAQLAEMALPILPKSKQGIEHVAKRDGWPFEYIKGQGRGGRLKKFVLSELPEEIQTAVRERQAEQLLAQSQPAVLPSVAKAKRPAAVRRMEQLGLPIDDYAMGLNDKQRDCAHARMALAAEVLRLHEVTGFGITDAVQFVVRQVESGQLSETLAYLVPVANARANNQRGISVRTLKGGLPSRRFVQCAVGRVCTAPDQNRDAGGADCLAGGFYGAPLPPECPEAGTQLSGICQRLVYRPTGLRAAELGYGAAGMEKAAADYAAARTDDGCGLQIAAALYPARLAGFTAK